MCCFKIFRFPITALALLAAFTQPLPAQEPSPTPETPANVISFEALVAPEFQIDLASTAEGILAEVLVKEGTSLGAGDPLVRLNSEEESIRLRSADLVARRFSEDAQALKRLYEEKAASRDDYNRAIIQAQQSTAERDLFAIRLRERTISSPIAGNVLRILKEPGESVQRLEKVAEIIALDRKYLIGYLDGHLLGSVKPGQDADVQPARTGAAPLRGKVEAVDPVLDPGGKVFRVKILLEDRGNLLDVGTRVPVKLHLE